jgi:transcriptional regulator with XRE-family HTH domain
MAGRAGDRERSSLRKRVGAFVRKRREALGLSQGDVIRALGYVSRNSVSNIETGREGLPAKRIYAWADLLRVPHDAFYRFATGETRRMDVAEHAPAAPAAGALSAAELELLAAYRSLPSKLQRQLRSQAREYSASVGPVAPR